MKSIGRIIELFKKIRIALRWVKTAFPLRHEFGNCGTNTVLLYPLKIYSPQSVFIEENVKITSGLHIINTPTEKVVIKKYSSLAANCTIMTNNHIKTVSVPQFLLGASHVNDKSGDVIIHEDVWLGANVTIMAGVHIGRGCVIGAGSIVTKSLPPYSVAVGIPAKIVKKTFSIEQILKHEVALYPKTERFTQEELEALSQTYYDKLKVLGVGDETLDKEAIMRINAIKEMLHYEENQINGISNE